MQVVLSLCVYDSDTKTVLLPQRFGKIPLLKTSGFVFPEMQYDVDFVNVKLPKGWMGRKNMEHRIYMIDQNGYERFSFKWWIGPGARSIGMGELHCELAL
jgi:hypothetical protein